MSFQESFKTVFHSFGQQRRRHDHRRCVPSVERLTRIYAFWYRMIELEQICEVAGRNMMKSFEGQQTIVYIRYDNESEASVESLGSLLRRVHDIHCQIDSSQCLAQLTPARVGKARSVHVQLGASPHVIR